MILLSSLSLLLSFSRLAFVQFNAQANSNVAAYWGQNSAGGQNTQQRLSYYCQSNSADIILLSFLDTFYSTDGLPSINFASACQSSEFPGTNLLQCDEIASDIKTCQAAGKIIMLSIGGASGSYGFTSDNEAQQFADELWNLFGGGSSDTRPFGNSVIDGFDLDIEGGSTTGYAAFITQMRTHYASDTSKQYYISGAPQCPIPDYYLSSAITQADFDLSLFNSTIITVDCNNGSQTMETKILTMTRGIRLSSLSQKIQKLKFILELLLLNRQLVLVMSLLQAC